VGADAVRRGGILDATQTVVEGLEAAPGLGQAPIGHRAVDEQGDPLGTTEVEVVADGRLEPGPGPARLVEDRGVRDLELGDGFDIFFVISGLLISPNLIEESS